MRRRLLICFGTNLHALVMIIIKLKLYTGAISEASDNYMHMNIPRMQNRNVPMSRSCLAIILSGLSGALLCCKIEVKLAVCPTITRLSSWPM